MKIDTRNAIIVVLIIFTAINTFYLGRVMRKQTELRQQLTAYADLGDQDVLRSCRRK